jgi:hypothetical protein
MDYYFLARLRRAGSGAEFFESSLYVFLYLQTMLLPVIYLTNTLKDPYGMTEKVYTFHVLLSVNPVCPVLHGIGSIGFNH